jgi:hypothetical protein
MAASDTRSIWTPIGDQFDKRSLFTGVLASSWDLTVSIVLESKQVVLPVSDFTSNHQR